MLSKNDFIFRNIIIIHANDGYKVSCKNENLIILDQENNLILQNSCYRTQALWMIGHSQLSSGILERSKKFAFPIYILSVNLRNIGIWNSGSEGNTLLREIQYQYSSIELAKHIILNKINNQIILLKSVRKKTLSLKDNIKNMLSYKDSLTYCKSIQEIMGYEGMASKIFFNHWFCEMNWQGRKPRTKINPINVIMDMGYTYLFYFVENMLNLYGFDIYKGIYHQAFYQRKSLVCVIVEPFRCIIDKSILKAYHLGQFKECDFIKKEHEYKLDTKKIKFYNGWLLQSIMEYKESIFDYIQNYYRSFIRQKEIEYFPWFEYNNDKI